MDVNPDFRDLFAAFNACGVRFLIAGAYAVIYFTEPRFTKDLDLWVEPSPENAARVWRALLAFGAPLDDVSMEDFHNSALVYQVGVPPNRIDIMMGIPGVRFASAWKNRVHGTYADQRVNIMSLRDLIRAKRKAARLQDQLDIERLRAKRQEA